jgi:hypothetical protein
MRVHAVHAGSCGVMRVHAGKCQPLNENLSYYGFSISVEELFTKIRSRMSLEVTARVLAESVLMFFGTRALLKRAPVPTACRALCVLSTLLSTPKRAQIQKS